MDLKFAKAAYANHSFVPVRLMLSFESFQFSYECQVLFYLHLLELNLAFYLRRFAFESHFIRIIYISVKSVCYISVNICSKGLNVFHKSDLLSKDYVLYLYFYVHPICSIWKIAISSLLEFKHFD